MYSRLQNYKAAVVLFAIAGLILAFTQRFSWSWTVASLIYDESVDIASQQHENYWNIPGNSSSVLPLTNSNIDMYIDLKKFREQLRKQYKQCQDLTEDPFTMFRSQPSNTTNFTAEMDRQRIDLAFLCGGALYPEYLTTSPREELYPFEVFYLSEPPLWDESTVASYEHSTINLYGPNKTYNVGDAVSIVINLFDRKGRPRLKGGDRLQIWLKDGKFQHSISTNITDFNNGTYLATTVLPWAGTVRVMAILRQSREFFRALTFLHRALKALIPFAGAYQNAQASECVPCSPNPLVTGFNKSELCNLTLENGTPWYCGRPSKRELNCSHYQYFTYWGRPFDLPVTPAEDKLLKQPTSKHFLTGNIVFNVEATESGLTRMQDSNVPCNKVSARSTWHQSEPTGYFYHKVWKPFLCFVPDNVEKVDESCLKNVQVVLYGDSNSRMFYDRITSKVQCTETLFSKEAVLKHSRKVCENKIINITIQNRYHGSPFNIGWGVFYGTSVLYSPERMFSVIPSEGRYILSFNHYLHFVVHHLSVYERALIALREEIVKLLKRNPHGQILLRGPHVAKREPADYYVGDVLAQYITTIQKETFRDLQDRIIYFPTWDITVASEDTDLHPECNNHLFDLMLHFMCDRDQ